MMGIRALCFVIAVVLFTNHFGWLAAIPALGAIFIPYFAVVIAKRRREPDNTRASWSTSRTCPRPVTRRGRRKQTRETAARRRRVQVITNLLRDWPAQRCPKIRRN